MVKTEYVELKLIGIYNEKYQKSSIRDVLPVLLVDVAAFFIITKQRWQI
jgi:hypothetical protein